MGIFNDKLDRLIGNKKQKEAAEMLVNMVNNKDVEPEQPTGIESIKIIQGKANGFVQLSLTDESGEKQYSTTKIYGATQNLAGVMSAADKRKLDSINPSPENQKIQVVNFDWPTQAGQQVSVNTEEMGLTEKDFITPMLNVGVGNRNFLPWQILSLKALMEQGEWTAKYNHMGVDYNLTIGCITEQVQVDDPEDWDLEEYKITGVYIFYTMVEIK